MKHPNPLRKLIVIFIVSALIFPSKAQVPDSLLKRTDANKIALNIGPENYHTDKDFYACKLRNRDNKSMLSSRAFWISGYDNGNKLHLAVNQYGQRGSDFVSGPLDLLGQSNSGWMKQYNKVFAMKASTIEAHRAEFLKSGKVANVDPSIKIWPAYAYNGADTFPLAPWVDENKNGFYDPENGDYPKIKGYEFFFTVYNDDCLHGESGGASFGLQIKESTWSTNCNAWNPNDTMSALDHTVFVEYEILNMAPVSYKDVMITYWNDPDLGNYTDDAIGCAPTHNVGFAYNADANDEGSMGFGANPPVYAVTLIKGNLADYDSLDNDNDGVVDNKSEMNLLGSFMPYLNNFDSTFGNAQFPNEFRNLIEAKSLTGNPVVYKNDTLRFVYAHGQDPDHPATYYTNLNTSFGIPPGDVRFLASTGKFDLLPGQFIRTAIAISAIEMNYKKDPVTEVMHYADIVKEVYDKETWKSCATYLSKEELNSDKNNFKIYPVPASNELFISIPDAKNNIGIQIYGTNGRLLLEQNCSENAGVFHADISKLSAGVYYVSVSGKSEKKSMFLVE